MMSSIRIAKGKRCISKAIANITYIASIRCMCVYDDIGTICQARLFMHSFSLTRGYAHNI